jgi:hypothetical protein
LPGKGFLRPETGGSKAQKWAKMALTETKNRRMNTAKPLNFNVKIREIKYRPNLGECVVVDAVGCELVSTPNSLITGNLTGNFLIFGHFPRFSLLISKQIQSLAE